MVFKRLDKGDLGEIFLEIALAQPLAKNGVSDQYHSPPSGPSIFRGSPFGKRT
jgi:hypothetical protein